MPPTSTGRRSTPSILGTLFERGLDPDKRAQLGAHYTDRDKIMLLVDPVVVRPLLAEWDAEKAAIAAELQRAEAAKSRPARTKRLNDAERRYRTFLNRLRGFTVLDPACGSGNFLYLALQALKDLEHRVQLEAEALGASSGRSRKSARPTSRGSSSTPTRPSWRACRSGSGRSSGCGATASGKPAIRS